MLGLSSRSAAFCCIALCSTSLLGCSQVNEEETPPDLSKFLDSKNNVGQGLNAKHPPLSLNLKRLTNGEYTVALNCGKGSLTVLKPLLHYTITLHFFDSNGRQVEPTSLRTITLPKLGSSLIAEIDSSDPAEAQLTRSSICWYFSVPTNCRYLAVSYLPSAFSLDGTDDSRLYVPPNSIWSNAAKW